MRGTEKQWSQYNRLYHKTLQTRNLLYMFGVGGWLPTIPRPVCVWPGDLRLFHIDQWITEVILYIPPYWTFDIKKWKENVLAVPQEHEGRNSCTKLLPDTPGNCTLSDSRITATEAGLHNEPHRQKKGTYSAVLGRRSILLNNELHPLSITQRT